MIYLSPMMERLDLLVAQGVITIEAARIVLAQGFAPVPIEQQQGPDAEARAQALSWGFAGELDALDEHYKERKQQLDALLAKLTEEKGEEKEEDQQ